MVGNSCCLPKMSEFFTGQTLGRESRHIYLGNCTIRHISYDFRSIKAISSWSVDSRLTYLTRTHRSIPSVSGIIIIICLLDSFDFRVSMVTCHFSPGSGPDAAEAVAI